VVRHADCLAIILGEPYGTLILTLAVISIEVIMIEAVMLREHTSIGCFVARKLAESI
jgi:Ca2+:H+ antiporter